MPSELLLFSVYNSCKINHTELIFLFIIFKTTNSRSHGVYMTFFFIIIILFLFIPSYSSTNNLTYVLSHTTIDDINSLLGPNDLILANTSYVERLSSSTNDLLNSTETLLSAHNIQSIVIQWNTGDCSYPSALATTNPVKYIGSPICFSLVSSLNNLIQLTVKSKQLAQAATVYMNYYSLHYFTMVIRDSNNFYSNIAQQFSHHLTQNSYFYEKSVSISNFSSSPTLISSLSSRGRCIYLFFSRSVVDIASSFIIHHFPFFQTFFYHLC